MGKLKLNFKAISTMHDHTFVAYMITPDGRGYRRGISRATKDTYIAIFPGIIEAPAHLDDVSVFNMDDVDTSDELEEYSRLGKHCLIPLPSLIHGMSLEGIQITLAEEVLSFAEPLFQLPVDFKDHYNTMILKPFRVDGEVLRMLDGVEEMSTCLILDGLKPLPSIPDVLTKERLKILQQDSVLGIAMSETIRVALEGAGLQLVSLDNGYIATVPIVKTTTH